MKNLNTSAKFKLNKTIVVRFTKPGSTDSFGSTSVIQTTVSSIIGPDFSF